MSTEFNKNIISDEKLSRSVIDKKKLPQNIEAEQNILGSILFNNDSFDKVSESLNENCFYDPLHKKIYSACSKIISRGQLASPITLKTFFEQSEIHETKISNDLNYLQQLV